MRKPIVAAVTALALGLASVTTPVQAGERENTALGVLLGVGALALIADRARDRREEQAAEAAQVQRDRTYSTYGYDRNESIMRGEPRWRQSRIDRLRNHGHEAPKYCLRQRWTPSGWVQYTDKTCLNRYKAKRHYHEAGRTNHFHDRNGEIVQLRGYGREWDRHSYKR